MNKIKLMIKVLVYINALFFITFYLLPSSEVFANFTDSESLNAEIKLTLGNLALFPEKDETITGLTYLGGDPVLLSTNHLKNEGTLNGKLAYKIQINKKGTNIPVNNDENQLIMNFGSEIGDKVIPVSKINSDGYAFVTNNEEKEWILDGNLEKDIPITIKYKNDTIQDSDQDIDIIVTFLLVQTNASEPKETMFYDKISFKHELKLKAKEVTFPSDPNYWPAADDKNWKWNGEVKYNDSQFENIMYFSEVESSDRVRNLNDNVLYIELPEGKLKKDDNFGINQTDGSHIIAEVMEDRRHIKLTFTFEKSVKSNELILSQPNYYTVGFNYGENNSSYINFQPSLLPLVNKRILFNTDEKIPDHFKILPIYTTLKQKKLTFKYAQENDLGNDNWIAMPLVDASLSYNNLYAEIVEEPTLFDLSLHKASQSDNQDYLLINTIKAAKESDKNKKGKLKIILIGNNGNRLVIYRDLYTATEIKATMQSQINNQEDIRSGLEATGNDIVEAPSDTIKITEKDETIQDVASDEITTTDSSILFPNESVQDSSGNDNTIKKGVQEELPTQDSKIE